ncbi:MAG: hypothetical protein ACLP8A_01225 [Methylovirgula sp.]
MITEPDAIAQELAEKNRVIAHLTKTLAYTRDCLEIARVALERIAQSQTADQTADNATEMLASHYETARDALGQI